MKVALITGTSKGLGKAIAEKLIHMSWFVIGISRGEKTISHINYKHFTGDVTNIEQLKEMYSKISHYKIDLLVNNAAVFKYVSFEETQLEDINRIIDINLKGSIFTTHTFLPLMKENSRLIFINSVAGLEELENQSIYCASKHGLSGFAGVLSKELQKRKIKVTSIHPGGINTPLWDGSNFHDDLSVLIDPKQIANLIYFITQAANNIEYKTIKMFPDIEWHQ